MGKKFAAVLFGFLLFFSAKAGVSNHGITEEKLQVAEHLSTESAIDSLWSSNILDSAFLKLKRQTPTNYRLHSSQGLQFELLFRKSSIESIKKIEIYGYFHIANFMIIRFEGPEIIHPYNYFW